MDTDNNLVMALGWEGGRCGWRGSTGEGKETSIILLTININLKNIEENDISRYNHIKFQSKLKNTNKSKTSVYYIIKHLKCK